MSDGTHKKSPYELPSEFVLLIGAVSIILAIMNILAFRFPLVAFLNSVVPGSLLYILFLILLAVCLFLVIVMRGRMLAEVKANQEKLMISRMYEERFRLTIDNAPIGMAMVAPSGGFLRVNQALCEMVGYSPDELLRLTPRDISHPNDRDVDSPMLEKLMSGEIPRYQVGKRYVRKDGTIIDVMLSMSLVRDSHGMPLHLIAQVEDVTERNRAKEALAEEKERLSVTLRSIREGVITTDTEARIVLMNPVAESLTGWTEKEAIGRPISEIFRSMDIETREQCKNSVERVLETGKAAELARHTVIVARDGAERIIEDSAAPISIKDGSIIGVVLVFRDITERKQAEEQIKYLTFHDKLTGLYNRAYFEESLKRLDTQRQLPLSLVLGDVNSLKLVNDAFGHQEGDRLLARVAQILRDSCRKEDIIARWGGDEFAIILPRTAGRTAVEVCARIRRACSEAPDGPVQPSIALGVATKEKAGQPVEEVLREAESWMYRRKLVESRSARSSIISSLQKTLEERTYETEEHARRLQDLALRVGRVLGLSDRELDELALLAVLHDIGKIPIPDKVLMKPGGLSAEEWETMRKHPEIGYRIAQSSYELAHIADAILAHHERWDGAGYPQGLKGDKIPLISRIIAIADAYDAMTHERPYRDAVSQKTALEELIRCAGSQFDPKLVRVFVDVISKRETERHQRKGVLAQEPPKGATATSF